MRFPSLALLGVVLAACGPTAPVPDFHLADLNPASPRAGTSVSPRDESGRVSGWYFGHAT